MQRASLATVTAMILSLIVAAGCQQKKQAPPPSSDPAPPSKSPAATTDKKAAQAVATDKNTQRAENSDRSNKPAAPVAVQRPDAEALAQLPKLVVRRVQGACITKAEWEKQQAIARRAFGGEGLSGSGPGGSGIGSGKIGRLGSGGIGYAGGGKGRGGFGRINGLGAIKRKTSGSRPKPAVAKRAERRQKPAKIRTKIKIADFLLGDANAAKGFAEAPAAEPAPVAASEAKKPERPAEKEEAPADRNDNAQADKPDEDKASPDPQGWGGATYLSNDDTMSLSSAQRVLYAIDKFMPLPLRHIRPHEMLNYFSFATAKVGADEDFSVHGEFAPMAGKKRMHTLALAVSGRPMTRETRRNANIAFVIDRSGSMNAEGRMTYLKRGLRRSLEQLATGDIVHLVLFDNRVCNAVENFVVGRDDIEVLSETIDQLRPRGGTNLHLGLTRGYDVADKAWQPTYTNRVVMITDALTNRGVTNERMIATIGKFYDKHQIRLSGVGVGRNFNDRLLDRLTERGKGAYVFLGSEAEVDAVFGSRFTSLIETTALDVHFRLMLPKSLRMKVFYGEEASTEKADVQAIHYFANTSQLFLQDLESKSDEVADSDEVALEIEYTHPEKGDKRKVTKRFTVGELRRLDGNVRKGRLVMRFVDGLAEIAARRGTSRRHYRERGWIDDEAWRLCEAGSKDLERLSEGLGKDREVRRVRMLWDKFCLRYERPRENARPLGRRPLKMVEPPQDKWPGAGGSGR